MIFAENIYSQGIIYISPTLFFIYIDSLLQKLKDSGLGCHVGCTFAVAFGYADNLALVSPFLSGMRQMIQICEQFAMEYTIVFNPVKSKLMCFNYVSSDKPYITLCGKPVDVDNDLHLGNRIYNNIYTQCSNSMTSDFYRRSNQAKASFRMCDSFTLICILLIVTVFMALNCINAYYSYYNSQKI